VINRDRKLCVETTLEAETADGKVSCGFEQYSVIVAIDFNSTNSHELAIVFSHDPDAF
jgi:hypothetical protein